MLCLELLLVRFSGSHRLEMVRIPTQKIKYAEGIQTSGTVYWVLPRPLLVVPCSAGVPFLSVAQGSSLSPASLLLTPTPAKKRCTACSV